MSTFVKFVQMPAGLNRPAAVIAACRAGGVGVINAEFVADSHRILEQMSTVSSQAREFGLRLDAIDAPLAEALTPFADKGLGWLIVDPGLLDGGGHQALFAGLRERGVNLLVQLTTSRWPGAALESQVDGIVLKGHEAGGFVGEDSSFVLLQKWRGQTDLPLYLHGGLSPQVAAACAVAGAGGGVFDSQLLLMSDLHPPQTHRGLFATLAGNETVAVGDGEKGQYFRVLVRPGHSAARRFVADGEGADARALRSLISGKLDWDNPRAGLLPIGQDVCFAGSWNKRYDSLSTLFRAIDLAIAQSLRAAAGAALIARNAPLAEALGTDLPLVQGPMTRVSDSAAFACAVAEGGALPMIAFALLKGTALQALLADTAKLLGDKPWGIGLLGFAPQALLDEQLALAVQARPRYAIIAGGRPDQAVALEAAGIATFLHVPTANLVSMFLAEGARRFIFEGRECGGHVGPLSSFVLWATAVDRLLEALDQQSSSVRAADLHLLFAGGIHDALSSAMLQALVAPLAARGVKVGILMGSAYLFTREIVSSGAIVPRFQQAVIECEQTVNLESGPGHASRCGYTPFAREFFSMRARLRREGTAADEARKVLDDLIMGRLRIASKGVNRRAADGQIEKLDDTQQHAEGMYMLGQVATLRAAVTDIATLHREVSADAAALLAASLQAHERVAAEVASVPPADVAIIGIASVLPKAGSTREYWQNILDKIDAISEIPPNRWDWRLYFDADRNAADKIYSKWGGFLDDLVFDPTQYGMPPLSLTAIDPMQLMALEVAHRTLVDAGYATKPFARDRASVIIGASGGTGDLGQQYGLRAELPRFSGELPEAVAARLPQWTEDSFAGILNNVTAGRIANRLDFGGVNFTTDAACASSLAALYQGVAELAAGRSDLVIAGGVDTVQGPFGYLCFSKTQALSPRGRCASFDASGDGIVISEGIAMVALKRLVDAERDGDRIYAVIKGAGGSSDGRARGMTAPLPAGQLRAMRRAYAQAGFGPETVGLFEAHGTGTVAGDTAELQSTTLLLQESGARPRQAVIGSVKTMIGHTKATAGVAGLIKATMALHRRVLPPHRGVDQPNKVLQQGDSPLCLLDEALPWVADPAQPRRAAVSAFGFGGTNFHFVLEEYTGEYRDWLQAPAAERWPAELLLVCAENREQLLADLRRLQQCLAASPTLVLRDLAASFAERWQRGMESLAIVATSLDDLGTKLAAALAALGAGGAPLPAGVFHGTAESAQAAGGKLAVLFPGQGSQYPGMLRELALHFPVCADTLAAADAALGDEFKQRFGAGGRLSHFILPRGGYGEDARTEAAAALTQTDVAQPALGAVDTALWRLLQGFGLKAEMFAGHSYGEFVALHAAGVIDFQALMALSAARGRFIVDAARAAGAELGAMAAVAAPREQIAAVIAGIDGVIVANHNAPRQSIISGTRVALQAAMAQLTQAGLTVTDLPVAAAFHSPLVQPAQAALATLIAATPWQPAAVPVYSNLTAEPHGDTPAQSRQLMAEHLVRPVEFVAEIEAMYRDGARLFVELGPKAVLSRAVARILEGRPHTALAIDQTPGVEGLLKLLAQLLCAGVELDVAPLFANNRAMPFVDPFAPPPPTAVPPHAWLLNGSGARRAAEPVKQIGVRLEEVQRRPVAEPVMPVAEIVDAVVHKVPPRTRPEPAQTLVPAVAHIPLQPARSNRWIKERHMMENEDRRVSPIGDPSSTVTAYFDTVRQFLETQERVVAMLVGAQAPARLLQRPARSLPQQPVALARGLQAPPVALPVMSAPATVQAPIQVPVQVPVQAPAHAAAPMTQAVVPAAPAPQPAGSGLNGAAHANGTHANGASPINGAHVTHSNGAAPAGNGVNGASTAKALADALDRGKMTDLLLSIVEEKTGYPRDMIGLKQNLEADLGIDSIKRIELVGSMLQRLPDEYRVKLSDSRGKLNTQPTLDAMLEIVSTVGGAGEAVRPFDSAGTGVKADIGHLSRHLVVAQAQAPEAGALRRLRRGHFLITDDTGGVAAVLAASLAGQGCTVSRIERAVLADEAALLNWIREQSIEVGTLAGIIHLASINAEALASDTAIERWRRELQLHEKSLFLLLRELGGRLAEGAHVLSASGLGGWFGRKGGDGRGLSLQGGAVGMLKSLYEERPTLRIKAVDVDPRRAAEQLAAELFDELSLAGGRQEIGYPDGQRTAFLTVATPVAPFTSTPDTALRDLVVLATGGARGVTAEVLRELALPGNTLVLTGRQALPPPEPAALAALDTAEALRRHFIAEVRSGRSTMTPGQIAREVQTLLALREMRSNLDDFRRRGAAVEYHAVDVTDESALRALIADVQARKGAIHGVVHGAGVIEDKRLADKTSQSWSRVVETKVMGLLLLQRCLEPQNLKFFAVFSSVAGRYGNSGQSDYATANELMNRLCCQLKAHWQNRVKVAALCWGPWGPTRFGAGMVTAETEAKFAEKGVRLVSAAAGRRLFVDELLRDDDAHVEIVCGEGPWEEREAAIGAFHREPAKEAVSLGPLLGSARIEVEPKGEQIISLSLDAAQPYLRAHRIDGVPVLPAAAALELFAESAAALWPGWTLVEVRDCRLLKGIDFKRRERPLRIVISPPPYGSSDGFEVNAALQSESKSGKPLLTHYRAVLRFEQQLPQDDFQFTPQMHAEKKLSVDKAYRQWLFHGPCFQVITHIDGLSAAGARALVHPSRPRDWLTRTQPGRDRWLFDPALLDAAAQMSILWGRSYRNETALPTRFGRVVRYRDVMPERLHMAYECVAPSISDDPSLLRANVYYLDASGRVVLLIEDLVGVTSAALNRLGGTTITDDARISA